jgi:hypothetical protein
MEEKVALPNYIFGISTNKNDVEQRRDIVKKEYPLLLGKLMNKTGKKKIHNDFLNVEVDLVMREGEKEATTVKKNTLVKSLPIKATPPKCYFYINDLRNPRNSYLRCKGTTSF